MKKSKTDETLIERLSAFPGLKARVEEMLKIAENTERKFLLADDVEDAVTVQSQKLSRELIEAWGSKESTQQAEAISKHPGLHKNGKKKSAGTRVTGK